jgi:hypothetical protein
MSDLIEYIKPNGTKILLNGRPEVVEYAESMGYTRVGAEPAAAAPEPESAPEPAAAAPEPESAPEPDLEEPPVVITQRRQRTVRPVAG